MEIFLELQQNIKPSESQLFYNSNWIDCWHRILVKIRRQCSLAGNIITTHQLLSVALLIYFLSAASYVATFTIRNAVYMEVTITVCVFCAISTCRVVIKIYFAVRITNTVILNYKPRWSCKSFSNFYFFSF